MKIADILKYQAEKLEKEYNKPVPSVWRTLKKTKKELEKERKEKNLWKK